ncbi:hypothetical protein [Peribacillus alkalitolerans]|uniref:hypothetical protein n=1 Tax=Peribacillus alkalitolerans TaxID=1550385 RepID=UPI0013D75763|nr:hypothetical protein [Peribacillus alkalitolerans]
MEKSSPSQFERYSEVMLKQKIIHLSSELSKYKSLVKDFRESYQFSRVEKLIEENKKLNEFVNNYEKQPQTETVVNENHLQTETVVNENQLKTETVVNETLLQTESVVHENLKEHKAEIEKSVGIEEDDRLQKDEVNSLITHYQEKIAEYEKKEKQWKKVLKKMKSFQDEKAELLRQNEELADKLANEEEYYHNLLVRVSRLNSDLYNANQREEELQNHVSELQYRLEALQAKYTDIENE